MTSPISALLGGQHVWIPVTGRSMAPLLLPGDEVLVTRLSHWPPPVGAVLLVVDPVGRFVVHRVCASTWFQCTTHGLANALPDPPVGRSAVLGVATRRRRGATGQGVRLPRLSAPVASVLGWSIRVSRWLQVRVRA